jgi:hypothetical protein
MNSLPIEKFKAGQVSAAIWENKVMVNDRETVMLKASIQRRYKDKDGEWKSSSSFGRNEIPLAIHCLQKAFEKIIEKQNAASSDSNSVDIEDIR